MFYLLIRDKNRLQNELLHGHVFEKRHVAYFHSDLHDFELLECGFENLLLDNIILLWYFITENFIILRVTIVLNDKVFN